MIAICLLIGLPLLLALLYAEPLARWAFRFGDRLHALARRIDRYIEIHGEHTLTLPQKIRWVIEQWREVNR